MKQTLKRMCLLIAGWAIYTNTTVFSAESLSIADDFIAYMKETTNPHEFGLNPDGRFYPYSSPRGRRIGYDRSVTDKELYRRGCTKAEAERQLRLETEKALGELTRYMAGAYPARPFNQLSRKSQEILLDFAVSEGARNIPASFYETVINEDWRQLFDNFMYIRWIEKGWPDTTKNKAFANRWLDPQSRLRPAALRLILK